MPRRNRARHQQCAAQSEARKQIDRDLSWSRLSGAVLAGVLLSARPGGKNRRNGSHGQYLGRRVRERPFRRRGSSTLHSREEWSAPGKLGGQAPPGTRDPVARRRPLIHSPQGRGPTHREIQSQSRQLKRLRGTPNAVTVAKHEHKAAKQYKLNLDPGHHYDTVVPWNQATTPAFSSPCLRRPIVDTEASLEHHPGAFRDSTTAARKRPRRVL